MFYRQRAKKMPFLPLVTLTFKLVQTRDQTHLPCEFGANPFSSSRDVSYTNKRSHRQHQKQNLTQFTLCSNHCSCTTCCGHYYERITTTVKKCMDHIVETTKNKKEGS